MAEGIVASAATDWAKIAFGVVSLTTITINIAVDVASQKMRCI
ncbi:MAG: hypothetical protein QME25_03075 [Bacteroidota bacterium]|nr:hypothetical protein [Bacteroidota bacterium]